MYVLYVFVFVTLNQWLIEKFEDQTFTGILSGQIKKLLQTCHELKNHVLERAWNQGVTFFFKDDVLEFRSHEDIKGLGQILNDKLNEWLTRIRRFGKGNRSQVSQNIILKKTYF